MRNNSQIFGLKIGKCAAIG